MMSKQRNINPYAHLKLRDQVYRECRAMAEYALAKGKTIPPGTIKTIERYEGEEEGKAKRDVEIGELVAVHEQLAKLVQPATPQTILLLDIEQETPSLIKFLGPVGLVRQLMLAAIISLGLFIGLSLTPYVNLDGGNIFESSGIDLLVNLFFFLGAAGLGASFSALYKANSYITSGTFDPTYQASYWIRFFLGLISGLLLAILIKEQSIQNDLLAEGIVRPLLAILGGFSADLLYTFLNRFVEALKSLFQGSAQQMVEMKTQEIQSKLAGQLAQTQLKVQQDLLKLQQEIGSEVDPEELKAKLNELMNKVAPVSEG